MFGMTVFALVLSGLRFSSIVSIAAFAFGMALTLEGANLVKRRTRIDTRKVGVAEGLRSFWKHMENLGNIDLQFVVISGLDSADKVIADVACKVYFIHLVKPTASTVDSWFKASNHATVAAANGDVVVYLRGTSGGGRAYGVAFHDGLPMGTGFTAGAHTTVNANTKSNVADAPTGFAIVGAP